MMKIEDCINRLKKNGIAGEQITKSETQTHDVVKVSCFVKGQKLVVDLIRHKDHPERKFFVASVNQGDMTKWRRSEESNFHGLTKFMKIGEEYIIAFVSSKGEERVERILALSELFVPVFKIGNIKEKQGGLSDKELLKLRLGAAKVLRAKCIILKGERHIRNEIFEEEKAKREREAEELIQRILARHEITVFLLNGKPFRGLPVLPKEWRLLADKLKVVLVESYDDSTHTHGKLIEAFRIHTKEIKGENVRVKRDREREIYSEDPTSTTVSAIAKLSIVIDGVEQAVYHFEDGAEKRLSNLGYNGGRVAAIGEPNEEKKVEIFEFNGGEGKSRGWFKYELLS